MAQESAETNDQVKNCEEEIWNWNMKEGNNNRKKRKLDLKEELHSMREKKAAPLGYAR
eukprot:CAMPEP_0113302388 /NCGR_PEP_ID=MMETSP0010_2-20120614/3223_1 /TAXON_ID=216773 ORGANISM="Corethron hystrix, Strain 308" /NCGR_SAMPLE_ID=MMETSP0010_2 /ASSEMBLY_ACC=CAM_ASM_000155 /LENGTH=57 /DNA_ID=CAMNT_0000156173 /DNA_START=348 /DNA_END=521 /DNA_ORIENTATION=- /assembly_acc=CAM_ASM_000155